MTHAHWDHVSGVPDFPGVPVLVTAAEHRLIDEGGWETARQKHECFEGGRYMALLNPAIRMAGSIVIVPAPGHTPGSAAVFVTVSDSARYAFVGDLVWQLEGLLEREERPWFEARTLGENPVLLRQSLLRMSAIATCHPQITIVPSHDRRRYASILEWSRPHFATRTSML